MVIEIVILIVGLINLAFCITMSNFLVKQANLSKETQLDVEVLKDSMSALMRQVAMRPTSGLIDPNAER